jgi:hypothetical protein
MTTLYTSTSLYKQFLINQFNNPTKPTTPNLPKELCDIIKSYCFYDKETYELMCNIIRYKVDICDIINEHVINNEQLFIDIFDDIYEDEDNIIDYHNNPNMNYTTIIYTIQKFNPQLHSFYFTMHNVIDVCLKCGNYITSNTHEIPNKIRCAC